MPLRITLTFVSFGRMLKSKASPMKHLRRSIILLIMSMIVGTIYLVRRPQGKSVRIKKYVPRELMKLCEISYETSRKPQSAELPTIYFVTPTYPRREQAPELIRLGQTLMHVPNLHWIVVDDADKCNEMVVKLLKKFGIPFTFLASLMPAVYRERPLVPRGVSNRRAALHWIRKFNCSGVLYFGDDDNTFDLGLFEEIRHTEKVSMFPVGLIGNYSISSPVTKEGKVIGFFDSWPSGRKFAVDMAGFAVNVKLLQQYPKATMPYRAGIEEDVFLKSLNVTLDDIEPKGNNCTQILVWHTQTMKKKAPSIMVTFSSAGTNLPQLLNEMKFLGMGSIRLIKGDNRDNEDSAEAMK